MLKSSILQFSNMKNTISGHAKICKRSNYLFGGSVVIITKRTQKNLLVIKQQFINKANAFIRSGFNTYEPISKVTICFIPSNISYKIVFINTTKTRQINKCAPKSRQRFSFLGRKCELKDRASNLAIFPSQLQYRDTFGFCYITSHFSVLCKMLICRIL